MPPQKVIFQAAAFTIIALPFGEGGPSKTVGEVF